MKYMLDFPLELGLCLQNKVPYLWGHLWHGIMAIMRNVELDSLDVEEGWVGNGPQQITLTHHSN